MILEDKKKAFVTLGKFIQQFAGEVFKKNNDLLNVDSFYEELSRATEQAVSYNGWFTRKEVVFALAGWAEALSESSIDQWTSSYDFSVEPLKTVGLVLAGNIPLVGFHDILSVLISGNKALIKLSSGDAKLIPVLLDYLQIIEPEFKNRIRYAQDRLEGFDAVIATGSNNTARYFEYYFNKVPNVIRKNRNSVAVLHGKETKEQLHNLGEDIFRYYGLGCRNVSKIFVPKGYDFKDFFEAVFPYGEVIHYEKYAHNYDYNKAVFLMSNYDILDNGFMTIREEKSYSSPISSVFYEFYNDLEEVKNRLDEDKEQIQCVVSDTLIENSISFGQTQKPALWDYADGLDTLKFLLHLK